MTGLSLSPATSHGALAVNLRSTPSPLRLVKDEPRVDELIAYLERVRRQIGSAPYGAHVLRFTQEQLGQVRHEFACMMNRGDDRLRRLCALLSHYCLDAPNPWSVQSFSCHVKTDEEIWNEIADAIFGLNRLARSDERVRHVGRFVTDAFGIKIVVGDSEQAHALHTALQRASWDDDLLDAHAVPVVESTARLDFLDVKDYMTQWGRKATGWEAIKSVVRWWDTTFEVHIQPIANFYREREVLADQNQASFNALRAALRNEVADRLPLLGFYRDLLRWLFVSSSESAPKFESVRIVLE
jgi:hypothetical protein